MARAVPPHLRAELCGITADRKLPVLLRAETGTSRLCKRSAAPPRQRRRLRSGARTNLGIKTPAARATTILIRRNGEIRRPVPWHATEPPPAGPLRCELFDLD